VNPSRHPSSRTHWFWVFKLEWEGNKPVRRRKKNLWTKDMTDVKTTEWEGNKPRRRRKKKP
jgi:hypothetical protein